jgi:hypothetical protein
VFCADLDLPRAGACADTIAAQIRAQLEDVEGIASMDLAVDTSWVDRRQPQTWEWAHANADGSATASLSADLDMMDLTGEEKAGAEGQGKGKANEGNDIDKDNGEELPECRVIVEIDVQVGTHHLQDHIEWDLLSPLTPEAFARGLCADLGLAGEAGPLIAHAVHEELLKHKRDAVEWGVLGGAPGAFDEGSGTLSVLKDKTGLGLGWGKAPKDGRGRGPKTLRSVWRDWQEAEEFATRFELLSQEEVERREMERERATRWVLFDTRDFRVWLLMYVIAGGCGERRASSRLRHEYVGGSLTRFRINQAQCNVMRANDHHIVATPAFAQLPTPVMTSVDWYTLRTSSNLRIRDGWSQKRIQLNMGVRMTGVSPGELAWCFLPRSSFTYIYAWTTVPFIGLHIQRYVHHVRNSSMPARATRRKYPTSSLRTNNNRCERRFALSSTSFHRRKSLSTNSMKHTTTLGSSLLSLSTCAQPQLA